MGTPLTYQFSGENFLYFILPPILFADGYNLKKKAFFRDIKLILVNGTVGALLNFGLITCANIFLIPWIISYTNEKEEVLKFLTTRNMLSLSAAMCATKSVTSLMIVHHNAGKLFGVIFGEALVNDAVTIVMFRIIKNMYGHHEALYSLGKLPNNPGRG